MRTHLTAVEPLAWSNTGSPRFTGFPSLCACPESSMTNLIGSALNLLCLQSHLKPECRWTGPGLHSGQTTKHSREHARDLSTSGQFSSSSHKIPRSTSATRAISALDSIILPLQTFFSRVLLLGQQPFSSKNLPPERQRQLSR